jgi:hypothetical protein
MKNSGELQSMPEGVPDRHLSLVVIGSGQYLHQITDVGDKKGQPTWIMAMEAEGFPGEVVGQAYGAESIDRLKLADIAQLSERLKVPVSVVAHEILNNGKSTDDLVLKYGQVEPNQESIVLLALGGPAFVGKSSLARKIEKNGWTVVNFDIFSQDGYDLSGASPNRTKSFSESMDHLSNLFNNGARPSQILIDTAGFYHGSPNLRPADIFDDFANLSVVSLMPFFYNQEGQLAIGQLIPSEELSSVVDDYFRYIQDHHQDIVIASRSMERSLCSSMRGDHFQSKVDQADWLVHMMNLSGLYPEPA